MTHPPPSVPAPTKKKKKQNKNEKQKMLGTNHWGQHCTELGNQRAGTKGGGPDRSWHTLEGTQIAGIP